MANFAKRGSQSTRGWDPKVGRQVLKVGGDAEVSLWGGGPKGEVLEVTPNDPSVCTVHERPAISGEVHWRRFAITALKKGDSMIEARIPGPGRSGAVWAFMQLHVTGSLHSFRLVFFPGERHVGSTTLGTIYVEGGNGERFSAAGGESKKYKDRGGHTAEPTPAGHYILGSKQHVVTRSWPKSVIPYGATLRLNPANEVQYQGKDGAWHLATGPKGDVTVAEFAFQHRDGLKPKLADVVARVRGWFIDPATNALLQTTWERNDFGRWGWNLRRQDGSGTAFFIHTTPRNEHDSDAGRAVKLANSHGCIHLLPKERDAMVAAGYLASGVEFEVRSYTETGPP
jgi:hypothetical protein